MAAAERRPLSTLIGASLVVVERGAVLFGAVGVARGAVTTVILSTLVTGLTSVARAVALSRRTRVLEASLRDELLAAAFGAATPPPFPLTQAALLRGVDAEASLRGRLRPTLWGEAMAATLMAVLLARTVSLETLAALGVGALMAGIVVLGGRRLALRLARGTADAQQEVFRAFYDGLAGRDDLVASGRTMHYRERARRRTDAWLAQQTRSALAAALLGRAPLLLAVGVGAGVYVALQPGARVGEMAPPAALLVPVSGLLLAIAERVQLEPRTRELRTVLGCPQLPSAGAAPRSPTTLHARGLVVRFGEHRALGGVDLNVSGPSLVVITGPNGSGKSTLLRALIGIVPVAEGDVRFGDVAASDLDFQALRGKVSFLPQRPHLPAMTTVLEALRFLVEVTEAEALEALDRVDVLAALRTHDRAAPLAVSVDALSGGERQRVALARALIRKQAELFVFDEPDANLDRKGIERLLNVLRSLSRTALVVVAAHTEELVAAADVVVRLDAGRVVTPPALADIPPSPAASTKAAS